jgi:hypothetical protein
LSFAKITRATESIEKVKRKKAKGKRTTDAVLSRAEGLTRISTDLLATEGTENAEKINNQ